MEFRQVKYFVYVAEELHIGRAADRLHIVQSAVTQQIQRLERSLGVQLFDRSKRQLRLTSAGERLLPAAHRLLADVDGAVALARDGAKEHRVLRLATAEGLGSYLDIALDTLRERSPNVGVELFSADVQQRLKDVRSGAADASYVGAVTSARGLRVRPLWQERLLAVLSAQHPLASRAELNLAELSSMPIRLANRDRNPPFIDHVTAACREGGIELTHGPAFTTLQNTLAEISISQTGWTLVTERAVSDRKRLAFVPVTGLSVPMSLVSRDEEDDLIELLAECSLRAAVQMGLREPAPSFTVTSPLRPSR